MQSMLLAKATTFAELKGIQKILGFFMGTVLEGSSLNFMVVSVLTINQTDVAIIKNIWNLFGVLALGLSIIGFLFDLDQAIFMSHGNVTMHTFFMPFVKLACCLLFISNSGPIVSAVLNTNNWLVKEANGITMTGTGTTSSTYTYKDAAGNTVWSSDWETPYEGSYDGITMEVESSMPDTIESELCETIESMNFFECLFGCLVMLITWMLSFIPPLIMFYNGVVRKLEIILRVGFAPIAFADIYKLQDSTAMRWVKKLLALGLYGMGMILVLKIALLLQASYLSSAFSSADVGSDGLGGIIGFLSPLLFSIIILFAQLGACNTIKQAANEALGV